MSNELQVIQSPPMELSVVDVRNQVVKIQELMKSVMKDGEHFGVISGTNKPSLYKAGAEKIGFIFRLVPEFQIERDDLANEHREYRVVCKLRHLGTGEYVGEGVGSCSTKESKYRYRNVATTEDVGPVPKAYWDTDKDDFKARMQTLVTAYGPGKYKTKKVDGQWMAQRVTGDEGRTENQDIADQYNTVLKMAKKRAFVDATITATAASDFFTQDVEDFVETHASAATVQDSSKSHAGPSSPTGPLFKDKPVETEPEQAAPTGAPRKVEDLQHVPEKKVPDTRRVQVITFIGNHQEEFVPEQLAELRTDLAHAGTVPAMLDAVEVKAKMFLEINAGPPSQDAPEISANEQEVVSASPEPSLGIF